MTSAHAVPPERAVVVEAFARRHTAPCGCRRGDVGATACPVWNVIACPPFASEATASPDPSSPRSATRPAVPCRSARRVGGRDGVRARRPSSRQPPSGLKHLDLLRTAGLVDSEKDGRAVRYVLRSEPLDDAAAWMAGVGAAWTAAWLRCPIGPPLGTVTARPTPRRPPRRSRSRRVPYLTCSRCWWCSPSPSCG